MHIMLGIVPPAPTHILWEARLAPKKSRRYHRGEGAAPTEYKHHADNGSSNYELRTTCFHETTRPSSFNTVFQKYLRQHFVEFIQIIFLKFQQVQTILAVSLFLKHLVRQIG